MIFAFTSDEKKALDDINPALISLPKITSKDKLTLVTAVRPDIKSFSTKHYTDDSQECRLLSDETQRLSDVDTPPSQSAQSASPTQSASPHKDSLLAPPIQSWSQAIGCDGMHGDSGAPIYNKDKQLVGILWTGKYPKGDLSNTLKPENKSLIWQNYNYMVPMFKIVEELEQTENLHPSVMELLKSA